MLNLLRWTSPRTIKETFEPPHNYRYPFMDEEQMKIHEFQAKELLSDYNVPIQRGHVVYSSNEIEKTIDKVQNEFNSDAVVVKAQIHAGGRGKGGGVKFCPSTESAIESANEILGMNLITHQTGEELSLIHI